MTLDAKFMVELVWIASRANNCHYCLGHQETKLKTLGELEARLAAIDSDWSGFEPAEKQAFAFSRKLTLRPDTITESDIKSLLEYYPPLQALEIVLVISRYNMANRWNSGLSIPQETYRDFSVPSATASDDSRTSIVAPLHLEQRPELESHEGVAAMLQKASTREPLLPLVSEVLAREIMGLDRTAYELYSISCKLPRRREDDARPLRSISAKWGFVSRAEGSDSLGSCTRRSRLVRAGSSDATFGKVVR